MRPTFTRFKGFFLTGAVGSGFVACTWAVGMACGAVGVGDGRSIGPVWTLGLDPSGGSSGCGAAMAGWVAGLVTGWVGRAPGTEACSERGRWTPFGKGGRPVL